MLLFLETVGTLGSVLEEREKDSIYLPFLKRSQFIMKKVPNILIFCHSSVQYFLHMDHYLQEKKTILNSREAP